MVRFKHIVIILCFGLLSYTSNAQQYNFRQYNVQNGLAHSQVTSIIQDHKGYIWFSTYGGGISRFDGKTFVTYTEKEGLPNNIVQRIIEDNKGNLWLGTMGNGICMFDGKTFTSLNDTLTPINSKIYAITQDKSNVIWFGADNGLYSYDGKQVKHFTLKNGIPEVPIMRVFQDSKGLIWVASWEQGVFCFEPSALLGDGSRAVKNFTQKDGLSFHTVMTIYEDSKENIWLGTFKGLTKIVRKPDGQFNFSRSFHSDLDSNLIYSVVDDKKGNIWFGTQEKGLIKYEVSENRFTKINSKNGMPGDIVLTMMQDREGNLWLSNWGMGVLEFMDEKFVHYTQKEGLGSDLITSVVDDRKGGMIINTSKGIYSFSKEKGIQLLDKQLFSFSASAICTDEKGVLWIGTSKTLYRYDGKKLKKYTTTDGIGAFPITCVTSDLNGTIWLGSWGAGVTAFNGKKSINYTLNDGLSSPYIYAIYKDSRNRICIGTWDGGLSIFDPKENGTSGKRFTVFKKEQGLPTNNVMSIAEDAQHHLWLGTFGGGICKFDGKTFKTISTKDGLSDDAVNALIFDSGQNLFIGASKGLNRLNVKEYNTSGKIQIRFYGNEEGFTGIECSRNAALNDSEGNSWFATKNGLTKYNPSFDKLNEIEPLTHIFDVKLFFEKTDWSKFSDSIKPETNLPYNLSLKYNNNHLTFNFIGISTTIPEKVRYRYMLEGVDKDWTPAMDKTDATYSGIAPGNYVFKVMACNNEGVYDRSPATFEFTISAPFWQRAWFRILVVVCLLLLIMITFRIRTQQLLKRQAELEQTVLERTAEVVKQKSELEVAYHEIEEKNIIVVQKNRDITDSINYARRIQQAILPLDTDIQKSLPKSFILFKPRDIVSGDFYWFTEIPLPDENQEKRSKIIIACADCTGHGVPGAFMSMIGNSLLNEIVYEKKIYEPAKILNYLNEGVHLSLKQNMKDNETHDGMDIALICLESGTEYSEKISIEYAGAHRPLYIFKNGILEEIAADKFPIGGIQSDEKREFTNNLINLEKGDTLYMFSDGYVDQFGGEKGKKFMAKRFQELLRNVQEKTMEEQKNILNHTIEQWKKNIEQVDDILVIGVRV